MARKSLIVGNWKMNTTHLEAIQIVQKLHYRLGLQDYDRVEVVVAPPFTSLRSVQTVIEADHMRIELAAQDTHWEDSGAYTGEVSPVMLAKLRVRHVVVGHSERRQVLDEDDDRVNRKLRAVVRNGMAPILCVGETLEERERDLTTERVTSQVRLGLRGLRAEEVAGAAVAYEPIWAIGTGRHADPDEAGLVAGSIRAAVREQWPEGAEHLRVLYGGSVDPGNIAGFMAKREIDGALVGGASLDPDTFAAVVRYYA
ncbi:MAG: triose-phosphate isomerase [Actinomycetota bacterium]|nr:triose-phosphate isomerase [Actinomycetota bacterium]